MSNILDNHVFMDGMRNAFNPIRMVRELTHWKPREWVLLTAMLSAQAIAFIIASDFSIMGWIGLATGVFTILSLILVDRGRITNYAWGFLGSLVWLIIAIQNHLIGDMFSQSFYVIMQFVGIYAWQRQLSRQGDSAIEITPKRLSRTMAALTLMGTIIVYAIVVTVSIHNDGSQVWLDGTLLPLGIIGQILMTYGYRSQWVAWITLDIVNVVIWFNQTTTGGTAAVSMLALQIVMLINAVYGAYVWFHEDNK